MDTLRVAQRALIPAFLTFLAFHILGNWCLRYAYSHHGLFTVGDDPSPLSPVQSIQKPPVRSPRAYYDHVLTFHHPTSGEFHHLYLEWSSAPV